MHRFTFHFLLLFLITIVQAQKVSFTPILEDDISIRAIEIYDSKVFYVGTHSKFGYVNLKNLSDKKQIRLSEDELQFRTLAQNKNEFYTINIESPAQFFAIDKRTLSTVIFHQDSLKTAFYDALHFIDSNRAVAFSDPDQTHKLRIKIIDSSQKSVTDLSDLSSSKRITFLAEGEAAFAASNTNFASFGKYVWLTTGGMKSRIITIDTTNMNSEIFDTPIVQGSSSKGIYSIDFYDENFGIAVGGDYTLQNENINTIATTKDGGKTWQIQASGNNAGYATCVRFRPNSKGKEIVAIGDQHISYSKDYGKTWTKISDEKNLYTFQWLNENTILLAGKNRIVKMDIRF